MKSATEIHFNDAEDVEFVGRRLASLITRQMFAAICLAILWAVRFMLCYHLVYFESVDMAVCVALMVNICICFLQTSTLPRGKYSLLAMYTITIWWTFCCVTICLKAFIGYLRYYSCEWSSARGNKKCTLDVDTKQAAYLDDQVCASFNKVVPFCDSWKSAMATGSLVPTMLVLVYVAFAIADFELAGRLWQIVVQRVVTTLNHDVRVGNKAPPIVSDNGNNDRHDDLYDEEESYASSDSEDVETVNYVVMGLVGKSVDSVRKTMPQRRFSLRSCLHLAIESSKGLEEIHEAGFLHRDIKPGNMAIGRSPGDLKSVNILDWGLCRKYVNDQGKVHRPRVRAAFRGTPRYASANALADIDQGRVDDMWSWFFTLIELTVGKLPWDDETGPQDIGAWLTWLAKKKRKCVDDPEVLLQGCPREYRGIYDSLMATEYHVKPDYAGMNGILTQIMQRKGYTKDTPLDWEPQAENANRAAGAANHTMMPEGKRKASSN